MAPAGKRLPESPPKFSNHDEGVCGTQWTGWLKGHHPKKPGELITGKVCFKTGSRNNCYSRYIKPVKIRNCGSYFVYYLVDVYGCYSRYCAE